MCVYICMFVYLHVISVYASWFLMRKQIINKESEILFVIGKVQSYDDIIYF